MRNEEFFMDYSNAKQYRKISTHGLVFDYRLPLQNLGNYFWGSLFILLSLSQVTFHEKILYKIKMLLDNTHFVRQIVNRNNFLKTN